MDESYLAKIKLDRSEAARKAEEDKRANLIVDAVGSAGKDTKDEVTTAIHDLMLATLVAKDPRLVEVTKNLGSLLKEIGKASSSFDSSALKDIPKIQQKIVDALQNIPDVISEASKSDELIPYLENIVTAIQSKDTSPPKVNVTTPSLDLSPISDAISELSRNLKQEKKVTKATDFTPIQDAVKSVEKAIRSLSFPVANYVLPFKDVNGRAVQVQLDSSGNVPTASTGGASGTQYAELSTTAPATGTVALGRYKSSAPTLTDGQFYAPQLDASGNLKVNIQAGAGSGGTALTDDAGFTVGATSVTPVAGTYKTTRDAVDDNDAGALAMNAKRGLYVSLETPNSDSAMDDTLDTVKVSQATAANFNATVVGTGTFVTQATLAAETTKIIGAVNNLPATVDTNSGNKSASTLRVVLATDQPALTNKLLVTPDSVALPANQSVNVSQINAVTPLMGNGVTGTGSQRVTVASDNTPFAVKTDQTTHGTTDKVAADITQVAGAAISQGNGTAATAIRVALPTDGTGVVVATQATASSLNAQVVGTVAHDGVDAGNPLKVGGKALTGIPTPVSDLDRTDTWHDEYGRLVTSDKDFELGLSTGTTGLRDRIVAQRMTVLADSLIDGIASFWTQTTANGGTITNSGGEGLLKTSTAATGSAQLSSTVVAYYPGQVNWMNSAIRFGDTGTAGDTRRIGMFTVSGTTPQDGFYYELSGTTLNAVYVKAGTPTAVASTSWSRFSTAPFTLDTNFHSFEIRYTANSVWFYVDNVLRHAVSGTSTPLTATLSLPITITNVKTSGATDITFAIRNVGNGRFGMPGGVVAETGLSAVEALATGGGTPHDSVDSGNPLKIGGIANSGTPTAVAINDRTNAWFSLNGALNIAASGTNVATGSGTSTGAMRVELPTNGTGVIATVGAVTAITNALPAGANAIGKLAANSGVNIGSVDVLTVNGQAPAFNTGVRSATTQRVTIATDDVVPASQSGTWTVQPGNTANTTPWLTTQTPKTSGGLTTYHLVSAATTNATNIKASAGQVFGWFIYNSNATARKLVFHNTAGTPTAGASVFFSIVIPPSSGANVEFTNGIEFSTGIAITTVTGLADSDNTAVAANDLIINIFWK